MSKLPDEYIKKVVESTSLVDLIGGILALRKKGSEFVGLCPFHEEKNPSFYVNGEKGVYLCRSCGAAGGAFDFLMRYEGLQFLDAVEQLAKLALLPTPKEVRNDRSENGQKSSDAALLNLMGQCEAIYQQGLRENVSAQEYLRARGITPSMANSFCLGFAPKGRRFLVGKLTGFSNSVMMESGLFLQSKQGDQDMVDFMDNRIIFPIKNKRGETIAFSGRTISGENQPKYLNTKESNIFKKGKEFFGLSNSLKFIAKNRTAIVVEGYTDVVVSHGNGVCNVVSAMGVAVQENSLRELFKTSDTVIFCFDGDLPGRRAARKALHTIAPLLNERKRCKFVFLPDDMDPDEFIRKKGPDQFIEKISQAELMSRYFIKELQAENDMECVEGKSKFCADAMDFIDRITSPTVKGLMIQMVKNVIGQEIPLSLTSSGKEVSPSLVASIEAKNI